MTAPFYFARAIHQFTNPARRERDASLRAAGRVGISPMAAGMRACQKCGETKPLIEFPLHPVSKRHTRTCKNCYPQFQRGGNPARDRLRAWTEKNPEKRAAHKIIEVALRRGEITRQPCERCGAEKALAHHDDYSRPLDVKWLCHRHHLERHREIGRPLGFRPKHTPTSGHAPAGPLAEGSNRPPPLKTGGCREVPAVFRNVPSRADKPIGDIDG